MIGLDIGELLLAALIAVVGPLAWILITVWSLTKGRMKQAGLVTLGFAAAYTALFVAIEADSYRLVIQVRDYQGQPLEGVTADYLTFGGSDRISRFASHPKGQLITNASGNISIKTYHGHSISLNLKRADVISQRIELRAAGRRYPHQLLSPETITLTGAGESVIARGATIEPQSSLVFLVTMEAE